MSAANGSGEQQAPGFLIRAEASGAIYLVEGEDLYHLLSLEAAEANGYRLEDAVTLSDGEIDHARAKPIHSLTPPRFFSMRESIRESVLNPLLAPGMSGAEIGAGPYPHRLPPGVECVYFDKRNPEELKQYFSSSRIDIAPKLRPIEALRDCRGTFDFLIAHHCLEHTPDPVGAMVEWLRTVKEGGLVCISVPDADLTHDRGRLKPSLEHLILDHVLERDGKDFESREHIYSFILAWRNDGFFGPQDKNGLAELARHSVESPENDLHWHAFDVGILEWVVELAGVFGGFQPEILSRTSPRDYKHFNLLNDALLVFRKGRARGGGAHVRSETRAALSSMRTRLHAAMEAIDPDL